MAWLVDTSLWVDLIRPRSPLALKEFVSSQLARRHACLAEPVVFEVLRHATPVEFKHITQQFEAFPTLATPLDLWELATTLSQNCRTAGITAGVLDLLIACVAIHHDATVVTFDDDFAKIGKASRLRVELLRRPQ